MVYAQYVTLLSGATAQSVVMQTTPNKANSPVAAMPGLIQTFDYAASLINVHNDLPISRAEAEAHAAVRAGLGNLVLASGAEVRLVMSEDGLYRPDGVDPSVMRDQLEHILQTAADNPQFSIRVAVRGSNMDAALTHAAVFRPDGNVREDTYAFTDSGPKPIHFVADQDIDGVCAQIEAAHNATATPLASLIMIQGAIANL